jgi:hypothetical protein
MAMGSSIDWKAIFVFVPIVGLLVLGVFLTLKSGVASIATHQGVERFLGNLSHLVLRLAGFGVCLMALQRFIGLPVAINW